jgi:hypothetical protein
VKSNLNILNEIETTLLFNLLKGGGGFGGNNQGNVYDPMQSSGGQGQWNQGGPVQGKL